MKQLYKIIPILILLFFLIASPAAAKEESWFTDTEEFTAVSTDELTIQSIRAENLHEGTIQRFVMDSYGDTYYLEVLSEPKDWGWWNFNVSCTYPDGTTETTTLAKFAPISFDYDINIQSYWLYGYFAWETNIYVTLTPLSVDTNQQIPINDSTYPEGYPATYYEPLAFSYVQGVSNDPFEKVTVYYVTAEEFEQIQNNDILLPITEGIGDLFDWTWDMVTGTIEKIPYVGPFFLTIMQIAAIYIEECIFWINLLFIQNWAMSIMLIEFFILGEAIYNTKTRVGLLTRVAENHVKVMKFFIFIGELAIDLVIKGIDAVSRIISMIKPL